MRMRATNLTGWEFRRADDPHSWSAIELPHCAFVADLDGREHWQGISHYRCSLCVEAPRPGERHTVYFGAAMHSAEVRLDGETVGLHRGGYVPFEIDLSGQLSDGEEHRFEVVLDNRDDPEVPPGKPLSELDFCWYGGLYREVALRRYPPVHITEAVAGEADRGGGVFARTLAAGSDEARVMVDVQVGNALGRPQKVVVDVSFALPSGESVGQSRTEVELSASGAQWTTQEIHLERPLLWSPATPVLHLLVVSVRDLDGVLLDQRSLRYGIRVVQVSRSGGLQINGERFRPRGTNRHQDHPRVGYALPRAAQYRDALRIKAAGFDYVRLSHYPQSPHFLDACDELGILVMNCLPGWQFIGDAVFQAACEDDARAMIRRDRNHACVVLWELSLNETPMDEAFMERMNRVAREEFPGDQMVTCGWLDHYDVYLRSRQHGELHTWESNDKALVVAEYGDWEYYASNEGFDQKLGRGLRDPRKNSRVRRGDGEARLLQQAANHAEALSDNLRSPAVMDGQWLMFDYPRGYDETRAACGIMDLFRLPKFSYHFYRSQRPPEEQGPGWGGPMVFIASSWTNESALEVRVFSNLPEVQLRLNGSTVSRALETAVCGPRGFTCPHVFLVDYFKPGMLEAQAGYGDEVLARHRVCTPGLPETLHLWVDEMGVVATRDEPDVLLVHAEVRDAQGALCIEAEGTVSFVTDAAVELVGSSTADLEAGIASCVLRRPAGVGAFSVQASRSGLAPAGWSSAQWVEPTTLPGIGSP